MSASASRFGSLRFRIALAYFVGALVVSGFVAGSTYALAREYLTRQRIESAERQSFNALRFAVEFLQRPDAQGQLDRLASYLQARGVTDLVLVDAGRSVASSVSVTAETIPAALVGVVEEGQVAYSVFGGTPRRIVFGSPVPHTDMEIYLVYSLRELDTTLGLLGRILLVVVSMAVAGAGLLGKRLADRTIEPLSRAGEAAHRVAEGLLDTRLEERDRDEVGLLAASFNHMASALQERIVRERRFVSDASHELRTPLTALKVSVDYLAEQAAGMSPPLRRVAALAASEVQSLQRLVDDLLELSRVESGAIDLDRTELDLGGFLHEVVRRRANGCPVRIEVPAGGVRLQTDKARLERVVGNLIENAVTHGGRDVQVRAGIDDGRPVLCVTDAGPGIAAADQPRIFERFWRADRARSRSALGGSGLGLAIARENAVLLGADIEVRSEPGHTAFTVRMPPDTHLGGRTAAELLG